MTLREILAEVIDHGQKQQQLNASDPDGIEVAAAYRDMVTQIKLALVTADDK